MFLQIFKLSDQSYLPTRYGFSRWIPPYGLRLLSTHWCIAPFDGAEIVEANPYEGTQDRVSNPISGLVLAVPLA